MELIKNGRNNYNKFYECIQDATITFSMVNTETNVFKIANAQAYVMPREVEGCVTEYLICYDWKPRDTKEKGVYEGTFTIHFNGNISSEYSTYPQGDLIVPIKEKLIIVIQ